METFSREVDDELELDALMVRVREAAVGTAASASAASLAPDTAEGDDLVKVIEAQSAWNEQTRKTLADLVECLRSMRDDWAATQHGLRQEMSRLAALVEQIRSAQGAPEPPVRQATAARSRRASAATRARRTRPAKGGRQRS